MKYDITSFLTWRHFIIRLKKNHRQIVLQKQFVESQFVLNRSGKQFYNH